MKKTLPTPRFVRALLDLGLANVSTQSRAAGPYPAVRVSYLYDRTPSAPFVTAVAQIDVWHPDDLVAGDLAFDIANRWPGVRGTLDGAFVSGAWVQNSPRPFPDPDTSAARYLLEVGLTISEE